MSINTNIENKEIKDIEDISEKIENSEGDKKILQEQKV